MRVMQYLNTIEQVKTMKEKLNQLLKNNTWVFILRSKIKPSYCLLEEKLINKIKCDIDGNVVQFKASQILKGYLQ